MKIRFQTNQSVSRISASLNLCGQHYIQFINALIRIGLGRLMLAVNSDIGQTSKSSVLKIFVVTSLYWLVHFLLFMFVGCEYLILLPYELEVRPSFVVPMYYITGIYLVISILFHYQKACSVDPGRPDRSGAEPLCVSCGYHKPEGTHHCSLCGHCVLYMDHHCVWINQCVGLNNHRYFLQFVVYVWLAQCLILIANYTAFWEHLYSINRLLPVPYCTRHLSLAPWCGILCSLMPNFLNSYVCFVYGLASLLFIILGIFSVWNMYLISIGETFVDYLQHSGDNCYQRKWRSNHGFVENWRCFLGLSQDHTFLRHILLPSSHCPIKKLLTCENESHTFIV
ncbi:unnamed protein product [Thelazia callipaeda]|uniref:Palmitoyltransferase n=1 Tax=Thelazia callipaeda TaxID=103827 RepID=A0A0N5D833_THECL|nr:unnamed protein product [Thelazia callipaeda]